MDRYEARQDDGFLTWRVWNAIDNQPISKPMTKFRAKMYAAELNDDEREEEEARGRES
jgi:hypothetical protein